VASAPDRRVETEANQWIRRGFQASIRGGGRRSGGG
jgi:hypothetical protein